MFYIYIFRQCNNLIFRTCDQSWNVPTCEHHGLVKCQNNHWSTWSVVGIQGKTEELRSEVVLTSPSQNSGLAGAVWKSTEVAVLVHYMKLIMGSSVTSFSQSVVDDARKAAAGTKRQKTYSLCRDYDKFRAADNKQLAYVEITAALVFSRQGLDRQASKAHINQLTEPHNRSVCPDWDTRDTERETVCVVCSVLKYLHC